MPEDTGPSSDEIWQGIFAEHEQDLQIPTGVIWSLRDEPDQWTFFIKAQALIESALTTVLVSQDKRLNDVLEALPLSHAQYGKITTARALGILDEEDVAFVQVVNKVKNLLVHDIRNVAFDFKKYFSTLSVEHQRQIVKVLAYGFKGHRTTPESMEDNLSRHPVFVVWSGLVRFIATVTGRLPAKAWPKEITVAWEAVPFEDAPEDGPRPEGST
jgi:hypothetical protein